MRSSGCPTVPGRCPSAETTVQIRQQRRATRPRTITQAPPATAAATWAGAQLRSPAGIVPGGPTSQRSHAEPESAVDRLIIFSPPFFLSSFALSLRCNSRGSLRLAPLRRIDAAADQWEPRDGSAKAEERGAPLARQVHVRPNLSPPPVYIRAISAVVSHAARLRIAATAEVDALPSQMPAVGAESSCRKLHAPRNQWVSFRSFLKKIYTNAHTHTAPGASRGMRARMGMGGRDRHSGV